MRDLDVVPTLDRAVMDNTHPRDRRRDDLGHGLPHRGVVDVTDDVEVRSSKGPREQPRVVGNDGRRDATGDLASLHRFAVNVDERRFDANRVTRGIDGHPQRDRFDQ
jgi:hypothetical protein